MQPIKVFNNRTKRALHLIDLYDLLHNQRERAVRKDWADKFKKLMHWPNAQKICRVDGKGSLLVVKDGNNWSMDDFEHAWLGELLRSSLSTAVSALDRLLHDLVARYAVEMISKKSPPRDLMNFNIPLGAAEDCIKHALSGRDKKQIIKNRPRNILKKWVRAKLNEQTFQGPSQIDRAMGLLGIGQLWTKLSVKMNTGAEEIKKKLNIIIKRRNQIVHEGDVVQESAAQSIKMNPISRKTTYDRVIWIRDLGKAINEVVESELGA